MKRRRSIRRALLRLRLLRGDGPASGSQSRKRFTRAVRRVRQAYLGVMPGAKDVDAANDS